MITYLTIFFSTYALLYYYSSDSFPLIIENKHLYLVLIQHFAFIYASLLVADFLWRQRWIPKQRVNPKGKAVFITGCDTGFGNLLARKLDAANYKVFAGCLFPSGEHALKLQAETSKQLSIVKLDVTNDLDVDKSALEVALKLSNDYELLAVVNNAGILATGECEFGTLEPFERQISVNCLGVIRVTKAFSALLRRCKNSRLVNVTSLAARISLPGMVGYCVSKCAALSFTNGIRIELLKWGVKVVSIEPHLFNTNLVARDAQRNALRKLWETSKQITRHDYGQRFFDGALSLLERGTDSARNNIDDVVQALFDSVTAKYPERERKVCSSELERLRVWFMINILPAFVQDFLLSFGASFVTGKPSLQEQCGKPSKSAASLLAADLNISSENNNNNNNNNNENIENIFAQSTNSDSSLKSNEVYARLRPRRSSPTAS